MSSQFLTPEKRRFIDDMAALLVPWAMPQVAGRLYAYLLLCAEPVSLDDIAADLELSKSNASVTARLLEKHGLAARHSVPGSKRALYGAPNNFAGLIMEKGNLLGAMGRLLENSASTVVSGPAAQRLEAMSEFYLTMRNVIESSVHKLNAAATAEA